MQVIKPKKKDLEAWSKFPNQHKRTFIVLNTTQEKNKL